MKTQIKKGDKVKVITGDDKGKEGVVLKIVTESNRLVIDGVNMMKKIVKAKKQGEKNSHVEMAMPIHISNVKKI